MLKNHVKVAICVPYYKKLEELKRLLHTVVKQTFENYIVVITDESSYAKAQDFISNLDDRFIYHCNSNRLGPTKNCNHAICLAQLYNPEFIKIMHHDDYFNYNESLQEYVEMLDNNPDAIFVFSGSKTDINNGQEVYDRCAEENEIRSLLENKYNIVTGNFIGAPSAVLVRNVGIMMDENLVWLVDVDWYLKLLEYQNSFVFSPKALIATGIDGKRVTDACIGDMELVQKEYLYVYLKHSVMQDFSYLDYIIQRCLVYYKQEKGYWHEDDYLSILKDAINDGKKICLWGTERINALRGYEQFKQKGIVVDCYLDEDVEKWGKEIVQNISCMSFQEFEKVKKDYLCIVMLDKAKATRKLLAKKGINSLPYIEKYIRNIDWV